MLIPKEKTFLDGLLKTIVFFNRIKLDQTAPLQSNAKSLIRHLIFAVNKHRFLPSKINCTLSHDAIALRKSPCLAKYRYDLPDAYARDMPPEEISIVPSSVFIHQGT